MKTIINFFLSVVEGNVVVNADLLQVDQREIVTSRSVQTVWKAPKRILEHTIVVEGLPEGEYNDGAIIDAAIDLIDKIANDLEHRYKKAEILKPTQNDTAVVSDMLLTLAVHG